MSRPYDVRDAVIDTIMGKFAPKEVKVERRKICAECEHSKMGFCDICKCNISWKTAMKESSCPEKKW